MFRDKKGFLLAEETLKLILAVIAIGFLAYLLFSLYLVNRNSQDLEFARASADGLSLAIREGQAGFDLYNPSEWYLTSWPNDYESGLIIKKVINDGKPQSCNNLGLNNCICICKSSTPDSCDSDGV